MVARSDTDRRVKRVSLRFPDHRSGFDRRKSYSITGVLRNDDYIVGILLLIFLGLNLLDYSFTLKALDEGAEELNLFLRWAFEFGNTKAFLLKMGITTTVAAILWMLRRYRSALITLVGATILYLFIIVYHITLL